MTTREAAERLVELLVALAGRPDGSGPPPGGRAFVWEGRFVPVRRVAEEDPEMLVGVDRQKEAFYRNVGRFLGGLPAHDVLLWGERGMGKSCLVRTLFRVFPQGDLAVVEIPEPRIPEIPWILEAVEGDARRWILYLDDLSFREDDPAYRELKVLLEGGLRARPENTLVVATSNRRHLVPERFPDDREIHPEEAVAQTVSLADRFGLSLGFRPFDQETYLEAVERHAAALGADPPPGWREEALRWAMTRGIRSGRTALQAARELAGRVAAAPGPGRCERGQPRRFPNEE